MLGERVSKLDLSIEIDFDNFNELSFCVCGVIWCLKTFISFSACILLEILLDLQSLDPNLSLLALMCQHFPAETTFR